MFKNTPHIKIENEIGFGNTVPLLYGLPAPLILAAYMYAVCALSRLTQGEEEVSFS